MNMEDTLETISCMRVQEETGYAVRDWIKLHQSEIDTSSHGPLHLESVDVECRQKMIKWCIEVVDFCQFKRETVEIAMSFLDRFLSTDDGSMARKDRMFYRLASMACLYTAVKLNEPRAIDPQLVSKLSQYAYSPDEVEEMESLILNALKWRVNPPTAMSFVRSLSSFIPLDIIRKEVIDAAVDIAQFQTELALCMYDFVTVNKSTVAFAALMNAFESLAVDDSILGYLRFIFSQALQVDGNSDCILSAQLMLYQATASNEPVSIPLASPDSAVQVKQASRIASVEISPRSISAAR